MSEGTQRRLAAIVSVDVVGYSRLMGVDETGTLAALRAHRAEMIDDRIANHGGRIVKTMGDGLLLEFPSVVDATQCMIQIQSRMAERNQGVDEERRIAFRIGVNLGDVIIEGEDILGDGVNIAARLQEIAEPGGVAISNRVHEDVRDRLDTGFTDVGEKNLKNIARPVRVWHWSLSAEVIGPPTAEPPPTLSDKPSIAVLPFDNMSGDPEQEYFADGIAEDIITTLSRFKQFKVIARNSTFAYKGRNVDIRQIARELGVRYVLEGSVRRSGNRLRIAGQLIEASGGTHLWADRYDGDLEDVFELQDRITESVIGAIEPTIMAAEIERARRQPPENLAAYDFYLQALPCLYAMRPEENSKGIRLLHQAIDKDPNYAVALAFCAWGYEQRLTRGWELHGENDAASAVELARRALATNKNDPHALAAAGFVSVMVARDYESGLSALRRAEELNPNVAVVSMFIGVATIFAGGSLERAAAHLEHAIRVSPGDPGIFIYWAMAAYCHFFEGRDEMAIELAQRAIDIYPDWDSTYWVIVPALVRLNRMEEARLAIEKLRKLSPHLTGDILRRILPFRDENKLEAIVSGLTQAGFPD